jgi:prepilin-type processing-associated H-X9-DG protein
MVGSYGFSLGVGGPDHLDRTSPSWAVVVKTWAAAIMPVMFDCGDWIARGLDKLPPPRCDDLSWPESMMSGWGTLCMDRHNGGVNYLCLDWSARRVGLNPVRHEVCGDNLDEDEG